MKPRPFLLERFFARYEFATPYHLSASDCESCTIGELVDLEPDARARFEAQWLGYTETPGDADLRREIARLYQSISPDQVLVHSGAEEAIFSFLNVVLEPGDEILVHAPGYQSFFTVAESLGARAIRWEAREEDGWALDLDVLTARLTGRTRAIVINCPNNPTGYLMRRDQFARLATLAEERGLTLFSDEVYRLLEHDPKDRLPAACDLYPRAVSLGVMSKSFGLAGLRIGWIATRDRALYEKMAGFKDYLTICNSAPSERLAILALRQREKILSRNVDLIRTNLGLLEGFFARWRELFDWKRPRAGPIAFPRLRADLQADDFCAKVVEGSGVLLLPGTVFEAGNKHFRIGFGRRNLPEGVARLEAYLENRFRS